jgi:hypothetical protein
MGNSHKNLLVWNHICSIRTKFWWNSHWMVLFQKCVRWFRPSTKMAPTAELSLTWDPMGNSHKNLLLRNHWANCNQTFVEWSVDGPLPKCVRWSRLPTKMATKLKIEKRGGWNLIKSSPLKLQSQSQPNFTEMILGWSPSKIMSGISDLRPRWPPQPNLI